MKQLKYWKELSELKIAKRQVVVIQPGSENQVAPVKLTKPRHTGAFLLQIKNLGSIIFCLQGLYFWLLCVACHCVL